MSPRVVIVLNSFCNPQGGASRVAIDEAVGLSRKGITVIFVGAAGPVSEDLIAAGVKVICFQQTELSLGAGNPKVALQGLWNQTAYRGMRQLLYGLDPRDTVVHLHSFSQALSSSPVRCATQRGFPVVCTLHDYFTACPNGGFFDYVSQLPCHRDPLSLRCLVANCDKRRYAHKAYRVLRSQVQRLAGGVPASIKHYIALSRASAGLLRPHLPDDAKIYYVGNPVWVDRKPAVAVGRNTRIVAVGRLEPEKGIQILIDAAKAVRADVLLVGDGSLRQSAEASGVCRVTGWLPRAEVLRNLESARCLVFPSVCYETFGLSVSEAAARGIPAIVSDITSTVERVKDGVTGWIVRAGDVDDLSRCLSGVMADEKVSAAGRAAYANFWENPPTIESHTNELLKVYDDMLETRPVAW